MVEIVPRYAGRMMIDVAFIDGGRARVSVHKREGWVLWQVMVLTTHKNRQLDLPPYLIDTRHCHGR